MEDYKRKAFLEAFLQALGASYLIWDSSGDNYISGTVVYDSDDENEKQNFIWKIEESNTPNNNVITLLNYLKENHFLEGDKLKVPINGINVPGLDNIAKERAFEALFDVSVSMVDDGEETDSYFIHN